MATALSSTMALVKTAPEKFSVRYVSVLNKNKGLSYPPFAFPETLMTGACQDIVYGKHRLGFDGAFCILRNDTLVHSQAGGGERGPLGSAEL